MMNELQHETVMLAEAVDGLNIKADGNYIDATFGRGGHSAAILKRLGPNGRLLGFDKDPEAIAAAKQPPFDDPRFTIEQASFDRLQEVVTSRGWDQKIDGILFDLGVSSPQLDDATRGFSFNKEGPLDMRMNPTIGMDAATWLSQASAEEIARVLWEYGEERFSRRIAAAIVMDREKTPFTTTKQLADMIARVVPKREPKKHPATRSFQAIRIFINDELGALKRVLNQALDVLSAQGRICVISFHSLEDRIVKRFIQEQTQGPQFPRGLPIKESAFVRRLKKVGGLIKPSAEEIAANPRARSARLRIAEKLS